MHAPVAYAVEQHLELLRGLATDGDAPPTPSTWDTERPSDAVDADALLRSFGSWPLVLLAAGVDTDEPVQPRRFPRPGTRTTSHDVEQRRHKVAELRNQDLTYAQIADRLGVARSTVHRDLADPDREVARAARARRTATCPGCGGPMSPSEGGDGPDACWDCALELRRGAARLRVVVEMGRWFEEQGRPPTVGDWREAAGAWPAPSAVQRLFGSWSHGLVASGFPPRKRGRPRLQRD
ncbi:MAG: helix-turn-helix domain-containing protein [Solirubrobacterales bacterium]|nr:helix-turn-helix domain-containing protein [Solirubrobacterales bacterium]